MRHLGRIVLLTAVALAAPAVAADRHESGTITGFECGDNCYLTIKPKAGEDLTGLCLAEACTPWVEEAAMPATFIGRQVEVTVGVGDQTDSEGNVMGQFPAFTEIVFAGK